MASCFVSEGKESEVEKEDLGEDLTKCSICLSMINEPKALPCLHTFCFKCLSEWVKPASTTVTCPMCRKECKLPSGVELENNFLVTKLKDRKIVYMKLASKDCKIPCTNCDGSNEDAVARCFECDDFLCKNCLTSHKTMRLLKGHHTFTLDELRSGKADPVAKAEYCNKHKGQELWIYCETCDLLICRDCTVFDHCKPEHKFVDLQSAAEDQKLSIQKLADECKGLALKIDDAIETDNQSVKKLDASVEIAVEELSQTYEKVKLSILAQLDTNYKTLRAEIKSEGANGRKDIESHIEDLRILRTRLRTSLETVSQLVKTGSACDIAQMHGSVSASLTELRDIKEPPVHEGRMEGVVFKANAEASKHVASIGTVSPDVKTIPTKRTKWEYQRQIDTPVPNTISDIALIKDSVDEICVVDRFTQAYEISQNSHRNIPKYQCPYGVICNAVGEYFTTSDSTIVHHYSSTLEQLNSFSISPVSPNLGTEDVYAYEALGIAICSKTDNIVIGELKQKCISVHSQDGTRLKDFSVTVHPWYISVNSQDHLAVSCDSSSSRCCKSVVVVDIEQSGRVVFTISAPHGVQEWIPKGVCWSKDDDLFVVNAAGEKGVHQFSSSGEYKGCIITGLNCPKCLTVSNDDKMLVADGKYIKVYLCT